ncbi:MAG TPA: hypothetical protein VM425_17895 [Myxococcota bacterium]|nr:hypothetical protein [Myxococcota bacterium]
MKKFFTLLAACAALVHCGGDNSGECISNADCKPREFCNLHSSKCEPSTSCNQVAECSGLCCGDPCGTGAECLDTCATSELICNTTSCICEVCQPDCAGRNCGDDGCGGSCGNCSGTDTCEANGICRPCRPDCTGNVCGDDGCGGFCDNCSADQHCVHDTCIAGAGEPGDPCPDGDSDCPPKWPTCLSGGGQTYCSRACITDADCVFPNCCLYISIGRFCFDYIQCGDPPMFGDPCPFDTVNSDTNNCAAGLTCLGIFADGSNGSCTTDADCSSLGEALNPDCAGGYCGASFCAEECPGGDSGYCPGGTTGQDISGTCYCVPLTVATCTDPINNIGCQAGEKCVPYQGSELACVEEGPQDLGEVCGQGACGGQDCWCKAGQLCLDSGAGSCQQICDADANTGCPGSADDYFCIGITGIDKYGGCIAAPTCTLESGGSECDTTLACIINDANCTEFRCLTTNGKTDGQPCQYSNDCVNGTLCLGQPATCIEVCNDGHACTAPDSCQPVDGCASGTGDTGSWGVCGQ